MSTNNNINNNTLTSSTSTPINFTIRLNEQGNRPANMTKKVWDTITYNGYMAMLDFLKVGKCNIDLVGFLDNDTILDMCADCGISLTIGSAFELFHFMLTDNYAQKTRKVKAISAFRGFILHKLSINLTVEYKEPTAPKAPAKKDFGSMSPDQKKGCVRNVFGKLSDDEKKEMLNELMTMLAGENKAA